MKLMVIVNNQTQHDSAVQHFVKRFGSNTQCADLGIGFPSIIICSHNRLHGRPMYMLKDHLELGFNLITFEPDWNAAGALLPPALQSAFKNWRKRQ